MTDPDYKALCAELTNELQGYKVAHPMHCRALLNRARAALAQPEPVPTDEELLELMPQQFRDDLATVSRLAAHGISPDVTPGIFRVSLNTGALDYARAVLARWGTPANTINQEDYDRG